MSQCVFALILHPKLKGCQEANTAGYFMHVWGRGRKVWYESCVPCYIRNSWTHGAMAPEYFCFN